MRNIFIKIRNKYREKIQREFDEAKKEWQEEKNKKVDNMLEFGICSKCPHCNSTNIKRYFQCYSDYIFPSSGDRSGWIHSRPFYSVKCECGYFFGHEQTLQHNK